MRSELLHVVVPYFNPIRWSSRGRLQREFEQHMLDSGVRLHTIEAVLGDREPELSSSKHITRHHVHTNSVLWVKENLINLVVQRLPEDWKYVAWVDGDVSFRRSNWASETVHALQHYHVVQPWEHCYDLGPNKGHMDVWHSWCRQFHFDKPCGLAKDHPYQPYAHCGYAWATKRRIWDALGGLIDVAILGSADHHMAQGLIGKLKPTTPGGGIAPSYNRNLMGWQERAERFVQRNVGYVPGTIEHQWHGRKHDRKYVDRWHILRDNAFDPDVDIRRNWQGLYELSGNKPRLKHALDKYFRQRNEDSNSNA